MVPKMLVKINVRVSDETRSDLQREAKKTKTNLSELVRTKLEALGFGAKKPRQK